MLRNWMPITRKPQMRSRRAFIQGVSFAAAGILPASMSLAQEDGLPTAGVTLITRNDLESNRAIVRNVPSIQLQLTPLEEREAIPVVTALAVDPSYNFLAIAGDDHAIRIASVSTGKTLLTMKSHLDWIHALAFSPDLPESGVAPTLYSAGNDGRVLLWEQGNAATEIASFPYAIRSLSLSTMKQLLAIGGFNEQVVIWDLRSQQYAHSLAAHCEDQRCVRFSPDGSKLLSGGRDGGITVWDTATGAELAHYFGHQGRVHTASFCSRDNTITSVGEDRKVARFDLASGKASPISLKMPAKLMSMCLINDSVVAIAGADNSIQIVDFDQNRILADLTDHTGSVAVMCPFEGMLASGSFDTTVRIWDLQEVDAQRRQQPVRMTPLQVDDKLRIR